MKSILDPTFRYTQAAETDIRKTFARVRKDMRLAEPEDSRVVQLKIQPRTDDGQAKKAQ
jgi:hypothetical protein